MKKGPCIQCRKGHHLDALAIEGQPNEIHGIITAPRLFRGKLTVEIIFSLFFGIQIA